ncbi:type VII secretion target [Saccharopolyspora gloriosae]|uniref:type VII secretion target n=1 Tax=Saccharopolyspora gloriosae TaxID=455344 RepID=UPI001FB5BD69|nr:type VII secretion target [Saccharopolyspora gloriosae]
MGFTADPKSIGDFAGGLGERVSDANKAVDYVEEWISFGYSEGRMFVTAVEAAEDAKAALAANYRKLAELQRTASSEVDKAAQFYRDTDSDQAERLDRSYE